jgi:hypothetical protein
MRTLDPINLVPNVENTVSIDPGTVGALVANESPYALKFIFGGTSRWIPAWTLDFYELENIQQVGRTIQFTPQNISSASNAPSTIALLTLMQRGDKIPGTYPCPLTRQTNIGNGVIPTSSTNSIVNDGAAANTQVIETTPAGETTSAFVLDNEGNVTLRTVDAGVWAIVLQIAQGVSGGAATKLFHGTADNATNATHAQDLNSEVTSEDTGTALLHSTVNARAIALSYKDSGGATHQGFTQNADGTTSQATSAGSVPATGVTAGALPAGVTLPASQLTAGFAPTGVEIGTSDLNKISLSDLDGYTSAVGIITSGKDIWFCSDHNMGFLSNAYYDGTNYRFIAGNAQYAAQLLISTDAQGGTLPRWNIRYSTTTAGSTGAIITWGMWVCLAQMVDTTGNTPTHIFTGTTAPSGQDIGDLWFDW